MTQGPFLTPSDREKRRLGGPLFQPELDDLGLDQAFGAELEASLDFADTDEPQTWITYHLFNGLLRIVMRLPGTPSA